LRISSPALSSSSRTLGVAVATFLVAFSARIANFETAFVGGVPQLSPFDELYHAKRIAYSAAHTLRVLDFDPSRGLNGAFCPWPPLYDMAAGAGARLVGGRTPAGAVARASWFAPIIASLVAALAAAWLSRRFGPAIGLLGGIGIALATDYLDRSRLSSIDHHFLEFPLVAGVVAALWKASRATNAREAVRGGAVLGLALATALLVQTALLLAAGIALLAVLLLDRSEPLPRAAAGAGFLLAAGLVVAYRWTRPAGYPDNEWYLGIPHAAALLAAAAACGVQFRLLRQGVPLAASAAAALGLSLLVVAAVGNAPEALVGGSRFLGGDAWLRSIIEFQPLFLRRDGTFVTDLCLLGGGFFLTAAMIATTRWRRGGRALLALFAFCYSVAAISSMRFLAVAAPLCAISGAVAVFDLKMERGVALARAAAVLLLLPSLALSAGRVIRPPPAITPDMVPMARAAGFVRSQTRAPGRVLAPWSWGHLFDVVGGRGVILDNFGTMGGRTDFENGTAITLSARERAVADYCARHGVRFLVLPDPLPYLPAQAEMSGLPRSAFERPAAGSGSEPSLTALARSTFWWRAYFEGGREQSGRGPAGAAFRDFRLVRVEFPPEASELRSAVQVWEFLRRPLSPEGRGQGEGLSSAE